MKSERCFEALKTVCLVETSPVLRNMQRDKIRVTLSKYGGSQMPISFYDSFVDLITGNPPSLAEQAPVTHY